MCIPRRSLLSFLALGSPLALAGLAAGQEDKSPAPPARRYPFLVVPLVFQDTVELPPKPRDEIQRVFFHPQKGVDAYIRTASSDWANLQGTQITDFVYLPNNRSYYLATEADKASVMPGFFVAQRLFEDLAPILETRYDLGKFAGVILLPNKGDANNYGSTQLPVYRGKSDAQARKYMTFYSSAHTQTGMIHELGHVLNIGHVRISSPDTINSTTAMSFLGKRDADVLEKTSDLLMWHKELLGWTGPGDVIVQREGVATHTIFARSQKSGKLRLVKVPLSTKGELVTIEAMLPVGNDADAAIPQFGVVITKVNEDRVKLADLGIFPEQYLPETQVAPDKAAAFQPGMQWSSRDGQVTIEVLSATRSSCDVKVSVRSK